MADIIALEGGDGLPPEPNWVRYFGRKADRDAASEHWKRIVAEMRSAEKLAVANTHAIQRLVVAYVSYDLAAKTVAKMGPVIPAPKTKVPTYNPWWTVQSNAASQAEALEKQLCISPRDRGTGAKVERKARKQSGGGYLKNRG
ncbi:P27 family phage terminase small subunit [Sphingomonas sp. PB4P5]|uniref:P27 family phage terminase small subunit n=1 Tax=Parasphingomonas puruogangriensis TaxID=3096155 RepID=UPI002FCAD1FE